MGFEDILRKKKRKLALEGALGTQPKFMAEREQKAEDERAAEERYRKVGDVRTEEQKAKARAFERGAVENSWKPEPKEDKSDDGYQKVERKTDLQKIRKRVRSKKDYSGYKKVGG